MTLGQVKSVQNFCWFGQQRAEKRNFWREKTPNPDSQIPRLNITSGEQVDFVSSIEESCANNLIPAKF